MIAASDFISPAVWLLGNMLATLSVAVGVGKPRWGAAIRNVSRDPLRLERRLPRLTPWTRRDLPSGSPRDGNSAANALGLFRVAATGL